MVGHYVGRRAGAAAQAVRCAGLKPGLDRAFGCASELFGTIVAQEPTPGSELARNGLVTLHVAAPGGVEQGAKAATQSMADPLTLQRDRREPASSVPASARRRRKPGSTTGTAQSLDSPPAPTPRLSERYETPGGLSDAATRELQLGNTDAARPRPETLDNEASTVEDFVVRTDDLFAGRAGSPWRRLYPQRRRGAELRARVAEHRLLVRVALALLAVWLLIGIASALTHHSGAPRRSASPRQTAGTPLARASVLKQSTRTRRPAGASVSEATGPSTRRLRQRRLRKRPAPLGQRASPQAPDGTSALRPHVAVAARARPARAQRRAQGGPFSP